MTTAAAMLGGGAPAAAPATPATPPAAPPAAPVTPPAAPAGNDNKPWWDGVKNPELRTMLDAKNYGTPEDLAGAYYHATRALNGAKDVVVIPAEGAPGEAWDKLYNQLGRPEKPDGYQFKFGEKANVDPTFQKFAQEMFHGLGASGQRAQQAVDKWQNFVAEQTKAADEAARLGAQREIEGLKTQWGGDWDKNIAAGQQLVRALQLDDAALARFDSALGTPTVLKLMAEIGKRLPKEGSLSTPTAGNQGGFSSMTPEQARVEIGRLLSDNKHMDAMADPKNLGRVHLVKQWEELHKIAYTTRK